MPAAAHRGHHRARQPWQRVDEVGKHPSPLVVADVVDPGVRRRHRQVGEQHVDRAGVGHHGFGGVCVGGQVACVGDDLGPE